MIYLNRMKHRIIISVILAVALVIGIVQWSRLSGLKMDGSTLEALAARFSPGASARREASLSEAMARRTTRESDPVALAHMEAILAISKRNFALVETWRNPATRTPEATAAMVESMKNEPAEMWPHFAAFNHLQVLELIGRLQDSPHVPEMDKANILLVCVERCVESNPAEALQLLLKLEDFPERERYLTKAFTRLAVENPGEAVRWFDEHSKKRERATRSPEMIESMMLAEARHDPVRAVAGFRSSAAKSPDSIAAIGSKLALELRNAGEHQALLAALRAEQAKKNSLELVKIRSQYIANLANNMRGWPVEEATALMDSEFAPGDKITASRVISPAGLTDADRWATWISKIDATVNDKHPLVNFVGAWAQSDSEAAASWLAQAPPGNLTNRAILRFATLGADRNPPQAARLLVTLPGSQDRNVILNQVLGHWKANDPSTASAFAKEHGLFE